MKKTLLAILVTLGLVLSMAPTAQAGSAFYDPNWREGESRRLYSGTSGPDGAEPNDLYVTISCSPGTSIFSVQPLERWLGIYWWFGPKRYLRCGESTTFWNISRAAATSGRAELYVRIKREDQPWDGLHSASVYTDVR